MSFVNNLYEYFSWFVSDLKETLSTPFIKNDNSKQNNNN